MPLFIFVWVGREAHFAILNGHASKQVLLAVPGSVLRGFFYPKPAPPQPLFAHDSNLVLFGPF
jgi:hypothetical protein